MSGLLVLVGGDAPDAPMAWAMVSEAGRVERSGMTDGDLPSAQPARTVLVLPGADAHLRRLDLPARSDAQARGGAEVMLGGKLAGGEKMHYAVGAQQDASGARLVAAIADARMRAWLDRCRALGADPHTVVLDCTAWPSEDGEVVIAATPNRVIVAGGVLGGFSIEPALAPALAARWLHEARADSASIVLVGGDPSAYRGALQREIEARPAVDAVASLARGVSELPEFVPNLRQGAFAAAGPQQAPFKLWRFAALLAVAAIMLQVGSLVIAGVRDRQTAAQIEAAAERDFRAARPDVRRIVNLRAQVAALANAQAQAVRHPVLVTSAPVVSVLQQQPLARLDEVHHEAPAREVRMTITAPDQAAVESVASALRQSNLSVETRAVRPRDGRYAAELVIGAP